MRFRGKTAIISGGAHGMGAAQARMLVGEAANVVIADIAEEAGRQLAHDLGSAARFVRLNVASEEDWERAVATASEMGPVSLLVNNAGIFGRKSIADTDVNMFDAHFRVNQLGVFLGMKTVFPSMKVTGGGSIVNISSTAGLRGSPNSIAYSATKWAVRGMTKVAAAEFGPYNIRVNSVHPGLVETALTNFVPEAEVKAYVASLPLARLVEIEDVAEVVLFLLSDKAASISGAEIKIDAGSVL